jgi:hypothetical protein
LKFYDKEGIVNEEALKLVADKKCETFSPAHLREVIIRSVIYDQKPDQTIKQMIKEIAEFNRAFAEKVKSGVGLRASDDDYDY